MRPRQLRLISTFIVISCVWLTCAYAARSDTSNIPLRAKYLELNSKLTNNQFQRALYLNSTESSNDLKGEIYAMVDYPFSTVNLALNNPAHWCDVLILHINIKHCQAGNNQSGTLLSVNLGKKYDQPLADTYQIDLNYKQVTATADYFAIELNAKRGPLSTRNYRIWIEATPIAKGRTFLHFTYAYSFGLTGKIAMQGYLATIGRDKVGFTEVVKLSNGQSSYIQGVRGVVERNTMRYYLAIDAYLAALNSPPKVRLEQQLNHWYNSTEQYYRQLHEVARDDYLTMKYSEYQRQQLAQ